MRAIFVAMILAGAATGEAASNWVPVAVNTNTGETRPQLASTVFSNVVISGDLTYTNTVWDDLTFPAYGLGRAGNADPDVVFNSGPSADMAGVLFDATADQEIFGKAQMRHSYKPRTALRAHWHWSPTTTGTGAVCWAISVSWAGIHSNFPASTLAGIATNHVNAAAQWKHFISESVTITPPAGAGESSILMFRAFRDADNPADTYPADADLLDVDFHFEINKPGTSDELPGGTP
jgi:hypothetical protein